MTAILTIISISNALRLDIAFFTQLCARQIKLESFLCGPVPPEANALLTSSSAFQWPTNLRSFAISNGIHSMEQVLAYNQIVRQASAAPFRIEHLRLHGANHASGDPLRLKELRERSHTPGTLIRNLFSHIAPFGTGQPLQLHSLSLHHQGLRRAEEHILPVIDWMKLESLKVVACIGQDHFFQILHNSVLEPGPFRLQKFELLNYTSEQDKDILDTFLHRCHDLRHLVLQYKNQTGCFPSMSAIRQNRNQLQTLAICAPGIAPRPLNSIALPLADLQQLSLDFPHLSELAIGFPGVAYVNADEPLDPDFVLHLETAASIPALRALRILGWPSLPGSAAGVDFCVDSEGESNDYRGFINRFATRVVNVIDATRKRQQLPELKVLCIGEADQDATFWVGEKEYSYWPGHDEAYVPEWQRDADTGEGGLVAKLVYHCDVEWEDQRYSILNDFWY